MEVLEDSFKFYCSIMVMIFGILCMDRYLLNYWKRNGFKQVPATFLVGSVGEVCTMKRSIAEIFGDFYHENKYSKIVGMYLSYRPALLITDIELIQKMLVKDSSNFLNHGFYVDEKYDPLSGHLFALKGDKWRKIRSKVSPLFSSVKLKIMFPTFMDCATNLRNFISKHNSNPIEIRDVMARYSTDIIASVAFGYNCDSINEHDNVFRRMGAKVFKPTPKSALRALVTFFLPKLNNIFKIRVADADVEDFIFSMVKYSMELRESGKIARNDFMQVMMSMKQDGISGEDKLTDVEIASQAFIFFIGAFETTSSTMSLLMYEVARNPSIQEKLHAEIDEILKNQDVKNGQIGFNELMELKYLDCCIKETLRKYPPAPFLMRECENDYEIQETSQTIKAGTISFIPTFGIHRDPEFFPNPTEFRPERFIDFPNGSSVTRGLSYLPFGDGPRICIGKRMGFLNIRLGLFMILANYNIEFPDNIAPEISFSAKQFVLTMSNEINIKFTPREIKGRLTRENPCSASTPSLD